MWRQTSLSTSSKKTNLVVTVTEDFLKSIDEILEKSCIASDLKKKGYVIDRSVVGRFGTLLVCQNMELLSKNPDLLLAASKIESSEESILTIEKGVKK